MSTDPYAAPFVSHSASEVMSELEMAIARLRGAGATDEEVDTFVLQWDDFEEGVWTPEIRKRWLGSKDSDIAAELRATRMEYELGTTTEAEAEAQEDARRIRSIGEEAAGYIGSAVPRILEWVGDDVDKAAAIVSLETQDGIGANRTTLLTPLAIMLEAALVDVDDDEDEPRLDVDDEADIEIVE